MTRSLYVYYRIDAVDLPEVTAAVRELQARLRALWPSLQVSLLRRPDEADGQVTLMEVYTEPRGIDESQQARIEAEAGCLGRWLKGARHAEVFAPVAD